jgi:hypothetical protein
MVSISLFSLIFFLKIAVAFSPLLKCANGITHATRSIFQHWSNAGHVLAS